LKTSPYLASDHTRKISDWISLIINRTRVIGPESEGAAHNIKQVRRALSRKSISAGDADLCNSGWCWWRYRTPMCPRKSRRRDKEDREQSKFYSHGDVTTAAVLAQVTAALFPPDTDVIQFMNVPAAGLNVLVLSVHDVAALVTVQATSPGVPTFA
jgi:hypothetical protein